MPIFDRVAKAEYYSEAFAIVTLLSVDGIAPRTEGRMAVFPDGTFYGTVGGGLMEKKAIDEAVNSIESGKSKKVHIPVRSEGMAELYIDIPQKDRSVVIIGAGHLGKSLADVFHFLSWKTTIIDAREEWATKERFPYSTILVGKDIKGLFSSVRINKNSAIVIANPEYGMELIEELRKCNAFYIGMVGSRRRDFSSFKFLKAPMGLDLGGETPEEVALSIVAEVVAAFNDKDGKSTSTFKDRLVIVRGAGDLATGTIVRLFNAGYKVIALECDKPTVIRRTVSFASAIYDAKTIVEGVKAVLVKNTSEALIAIDDGAVPIMIDPEGKAIWELKPRFVVDAILAKKNLGTTIDMADFVVALGPGFTAGIDSDAVIETKRGHTLGRIIREGSAIANTGIPGIIAGFGKERVIHSPCAGVFNSSSSIGDIVKKGDIVAYVDDTPVLATLDGMLRGLLHNGLDIPEGFKIADIDPRGVDADFRTISDKAKAIAGGVLEAIDGYANSIKH